MTKSVITPFSFENHQIRTVIINSEPWFVASDVCSALKISNVSDALYKLDDDEKLSLGLTEAQKIDKMAREMNIISESGMYTLVLRCRDAVKQGTLPHRFRKWVTNEVLPSIRKTGKYEQPQTLPESQENLVDNLNFTVVVSIENGKVTNTKPLRSGEIVASIEHFMQIARKAGYIVVSPEELLEKLVQ